MQQQETNQIKELVKISSLLSPSEKEEWLTLVELMNDKQLWELKSILKSSTERITQDLEPKPMGMPSLRHIMNLPKVGTAVFPKSTPGIKHPALSILPETKRTQNQPPSGFWKKVKDVLAEKELPPGHPEAINELELPAPDKYQVLKGTETHPNKPIPLPPVPRPKIPVPEESKITKPSSLPALAAQPVYNAKAPEPKPMDKEAFRPKTSLPEDDSLFVPGLQNTRILMDAKLTKPAQKPKTSKLPSRPLPNLEPLKPELRAKSPDTLASAQINSLEAVGTLTKEDVHKDITAPLRSLSGKFGYHKVEMALEKSPLFRVYINTGLKALSGKINLDNPSESEALDREEFEKFVDVLRAIKG